MSDASWLDAGFFVVRTPLLPHDALAVLAGAGEARDGLQACAAAALALPALAAAIRHASPSLWAQIARAEPGSSLRRDAAGAVVRYAARMMVRPVPFGPLGGHTLGRVTPGPTTLVLDAPDADRYFVRHAPRQDQQHAAPLFPNDTLHRLGGSLRGSARLGADARLSTVTVAATPLLRQLVGWAHEGLGRDALSRRLSERAAVATAEAGDFVDELVRVGLLVPSVDPRERGAWARTTLATSPPRAHAQPPGPDRPRGAAVHDLALHRPGAAVAIDARLARDLTAEVMRYAALCASGRDPELDAFAQAFVARYGARRVGLLEALDEHRGLGFPLAVPGAVAHPLLAAALAEPPLPRAQVELCARLLERARGEASRCVDVDDDDLRALRSSAPLRLPELCLIHGSLQMPERSEARSQWLFHLRRVDGPSWGRLLARPSEVDDALLQAMRELAAREAHTAEFPTVDVRHYESGSHPSIHLSCPDLRALSVASSAEVAMRRSTSLPLSALTLFFRDGRLRLHAEALGVEVFPRLRNAHAHERSSSALYRFLARMERNVSAPPAAFCWRGFEHVAHLPRVRFGRLVLGLEQWVVPRAEALALLHGTPEERRLRVAALRAQRALPGQLRVRGRSDQYHLLDFAHPALIEAAIAGTDGDLVLQEIFPPRDRAAVRRGDAAFAHDLLLPVVRSRAYPRDPARVAPTLDAPRRASLDEWLSVRLYAHSDVVEQLLASVVRPWTALARRRGWLRCWSFSRGADPRWHLRARIRQAASGAHTESLLRALEACIADVADPALRPSDWSVHPYDAEEGRYGGASALDHCELLFEADSEAVLSLVARGRRSLDRQVDYVVHANRRLLCDFGLAGDQRAALVQALRAQFAQELALTDAQRNALAQRHRRRRAALEAPDAFTEALLAERSHTMRPAIAALAAADCGGRLARPLDEVLRALLHMTCNRVLRGSAREAELVVYDAMERLERSDAHRARTY